MKLSAGPGRGHMRITPGSLAFASMLDGSSALLSAAVGQHKIPICHLRSRNVERLLALTSYKPLQSSICGDSAEHAVSHSLCTMSSSFQPAQAAIHDQSRSSPSSAFSSAMSSPIPPLPDNVLRSFHFPGQQRINEMNSHVFEALPQSAGNSIRHSRSAQAHDRDRATTANVETLTQGNHSMDWSGLSNHDLDLIIANLESRASERRNKIRRIEALSEELGLLISEQDWTAFLDRPSSESSLGIVVGETCDHGEYQHRRKRLIMSSRCLSPGQELTMIQ